MHQPIARLISKFKLQLILLVFLALALNANTLFHEYVLDDSIVISENSFVKKGVSGIPEILSKSYFKGYEKLKDLEFSGGRYRPIALVVFALEYQFFGANPMVSHLVNILLFAFLVALLFYFLSKQLFLNEQENLAWITCLLFVVHPIHTEVIANVKSRDELLSFIFILFTFIAFFKYVKNNKISLLLLSLFSFLLALLTRETAITFVLIAPLTLYFFSKQTPKRAVFLLLPFLVVVLAYLFLRFTIVGVSPHPIDDISNSPFLYASASQAFATKFYLIVKYLSLLFLPYPLSFEYGYNHIPYIEVASLTFFVSILLLLLLVVYSIYNFSKKSIFSFCVLYFFICIALVSNFVFDVGAPLAERFLFQPSLAFCVAIATIYLWAYPKNKPLSIVILSILLLLFSFQTYSRNQVWKNYETLVLTDVLTCPNSARINQFAMNIYLSKSNEQSKPEEKIKYLKAGALYGEKLLQICPKITSVYMNLGYTYFNMFEVDRATSLWMQGCKLEPTTEDSRKAAEILSNDLYKMGNEFYAQNKIEDAIHCYKKSLELNSQNSEALYKLGGNFFLINDSLNGNLTWKQLLLINPSHKLDRTEFKRN